MLLFVAKYREIVSFSSDSVCRRMFTHLALILLHDTILHHRHRLINH